ncbi:hypothetical protein [Vagococcus fluvialis]
MNIKKFNNHIFYLGIILSLLSYFTLSGFSFVIFSMAAVLVTALLAED